MKGIEDTVNPKKLSWLILLVVSTLFALTTPVSAAPSCDKNPSHPDCNSDPAPVPGSTCAELVANGAQWVIGTPNDTNGDGEIDSYSVEGLSACIDIDSTHAGTWEWDVYLAGEVRRTPIKGLRLVFEQGVRGTVYADKIVRDVPADVELVWDVAIVAIPGQPLTFAAMPHARDDWTSVSIEIRPRRHL